MNKKEIYDFIELQTRIKYKKRREFAEELGMSQNNLSNVFKKLKSWQVPILPEGCPPSTFSVYELNC